MTNIILITNGSRPRLLEQTLRTLLTNTPKDQYTLTVVFDGCLNYTLPTGGHISTIAIEPPVHIIGRLKNLGAWWSEKNFGRGEWIMFCDDDLAFHKDWLHKTIAPALLLERSVPALLGGCRHPFHGVNSRFEPYKPDPLSVEFTDAVAGYCHFMRWATWDKYGPYDAHAMGIGQSEDYALSRKIVDDGGKVGYIHPPVMAHCGITASNSKPAIGSEQIKRVPGVLYL